MEYRRLGSTGLRVSRVALGCGNFGGIGSAPAFFDRGDDEATASALMDRAFEAGVNVFDTADAYGGGRSEAFIGRWLRMKGPRVRDQLVLASKVFNAVGPGGNERGLSRVHILRQIDASLARLQTDRLDLYLIHEPDPDTPLDETLRALEDCVRAGKVLYVGASNIEAWPLARAIGISEGRGTSRFEFVQNSYSLLDRSPERDLFPFCAEAGVGFVAFSPLAGGWLSGKYARGAQYEQGSRMTLRPEPYRAYERDDVFRSLEGLSREAAGRGIDMSTLALAWVLHQPRVDAAVIGPRRAAHVDQAVAALSVQLTPADAVRIGALFDTASGT